MDSIPSSANQEDHVSMGTIASRKAKEIMENARKVIAMEILAACQAIDLRKVEVLGKGTKVAYDVIRKQIKHYDKDRVMYLDINKVEEIIMSNVIANKVEKEIGKIIV